MQMALLHEENLTISQVWERVCMRLKKEYGRATYTSWIKHLLVEEVNNNEVILSVPTRFIREWIVRNYADNIEQFWRQEDGKILRMTIIVRERSVEEKNEAATVNDFELKDYENGNGNNNDSNNSANFNQIQNKILASGVDVTGQNINVLKIAENDQDFGSPLDRRFTFDRFVVGSSNNLAFAVAKNIAESREILAGKNPLYLYGKVGLGKTHLMHAIALHIRSNQPDRKVAYLSAEKFMYQFVTALKSKEIMAFKDKFRAIDVLMIDDIQFICGKESTQEEFFHTLNSLMDQNKQLVIASDRSPSELEGMQERIRTRLGWGLVVDVNTADFELRLGILKSKVEQMVDVEVPNEVLEFLAGRISSSIRELEGALNKVVAHATLMTKEINLSTTKEILADLLRANEKILTVSDIQKAVVNHFAIKIADMTSASRARNVARPRQIAMYLSKKLTTRSLSEIGRKFGGKDHTTVIHAIKKIEELYNDDDEVRDEILKVERILQS